jgi:hypothetical protein
MRAGYRYDTSVFPGKRGHGGLKINQLAPYRVEGKFSGIVEFPITVAPLFGRLICFSGGGYLRIFPYHFIRGMALSVLREAKPVIFYIHPREIDPGQPRLAMNIKRRFKSYVNLRTTESKIRKILREFDLVTFKEYLNMNQLGVKNARD